MTMELSMLLGSTANMIFLVTVACCQLSFIRRFERQMSAVDDLIDRQQGFRPLPPITVRTTASANIIRGEG